MYCVYSKRNRRLPLRLIAGVTMGLSIAVSAAGLFAARQGIGDAGVVLASPAMAVSVLAVDKVDGYTMRRVFTGRVEANRTAELGFERSGLLREVKVREGERVTAGAVLAQLDGALLDARKTELTAALAKAQADLALAEATLERYLNSVGQGAVTRQGLDEAREGARAAAAARDLALARIASLDLDLDKTLLRAPFDGVVIRRRADEGRVVSSGEPVLALQESASPEIRVGIAGRLGNLLHEGSEYRLRYRGQAFQARLRALPPLRAADARTRDALFVPKSPLHELYAGELVELELEEWIASPGTWLPISALAQRARGLWQIYALDAVDGSAPANLDATHRISPVPVELVHQDGERVFVRGPIELGQRYVSAGMHRVVPGQLVRAPTETTETIAAAGFEVATQVQ